MRTARTACPWAKLRPSPTRTLVAGLRDADGVDPDRALGDHPGRECRASCRSAPAKATCRGESRCRRPAPQPGVQPRSFSAMRAAKGLSGSIGFSGRGGRRRLRLVLAARSLALAGFIGPRRGFSPRASSGARRGGCPCPLRHGGGACPRRSTPERLSAARAVDRRRGARVKRKKTSSLLRARRRRGVVRRGQTCRLRCLRARRGSARRPPRRGLSPPTSPPPRQRSHPRIRRRNLGGDDVPAGRWAPRRARPDRSAAAGPRRAPGTARRDRSAGNLALGRVRRRRVGRRDHGLRCVRPGRAGIDRGASGRASRVPGRRRSPRTGRRRQAAGAGGFPRWRRSPCPASAGRTARAPRPVIESMSGRRLETRRGHRAGGSCRPGALACRCGSRARRRGDSRPADSSPAGASGTAATVTRPGGGASGKTSSPSASDQSTRRSRVGAGLSSSGRKTVYWPKRTPCLRRLARPSWSSAFTSSAISERGRTPSASTRRKAMPRAMPVSASSSRSAIERREMTRRSCGRSSARAGGVPSRRSRGRHPRPRTAAPAGKADRRRRRACRPRARPTSGRPARSRRSRCRARCRTCRRAASSAGASAATPAARRVRAWSASAGGSSRKRNPSSRPMNWSSIETSPFSVTVATRVSFCFSRRIRTEVRRSTKRWVSCRCSASDSRSSTARVSSRQWSASSTQSARCAT